MVEELYNLLTHFLPKSVSQTHCVSYMIGIFLAYQQDFKSSILYKSGYFRCNRQAITVDFMSQYHPIASSNVATCCSQWAVSVLTLQLSAGVMHVSVPGLPEVQVRVCCARPSQRWREKSVGNQGRRLGSGLLHPQGIRRLHPRCGVHCRQAQWFHRGSKESRRLHQAWDHLPRRESSLLIWLFMLFIEVRV